jgi:hypothetical protein
VKAADSLVEPVHDEADDSDLRQRRWTEQRSPTRRRLFASLLAELRTPLPVPIGVDELVEPLTWFTAQVGDGTKVSAKGTLNRALVQALDARYHFNPSGRPPQNETHVFQVTELRELARRLGLTRRKGTILTATKLGVTLLEDPAAMWERFVERALALPAFDQCVAETWLAVQLIDGRLSYPQEYVLTAQAATEEGWRNERHAAPINQYDVNDAVNTIAWSFRLLNLFGDGRRSVSLSPEGLTPAGRTTALAILRHASLQS